MSVTVSKPEMHHSTLFFQSFHGETCYYSNGFTFVWLDDIFFWLPKYFLCSVCFSSCPYLFGILNVSSICTAISFSRFWYFFAFVLLNILFILYFFSLSVPMIHILGLIMVSYISWMFCSHFIIIVSLLCEHFNSRILVFRLRYPTFLQSHAIFTENFT